VVVGYHRFGGPCCLHLHLRISRLIHTCTNTNNCFRTSYVGISFFSILPRQLSQLSDCVLEGQVSVTGCLCFRHQILTKYGAHSTAYALNIRASLLRGKTVRPWTWQLTSIPLVPKLRMRGALHHRSLLAFIAWCLDTGTL